MKKEPSEKRAMQKCKTVGGLHLDVVESMEEKHLTEKQQEEVEDEQKESQNDLYCAGTVKVVVVVDNVAVAADDTDADGIGIQRLGFALEDWKRDERMEWN